MAQEQSEFKKGKENKVQEGSRRFTKKIRFKKVHEDSSGFKKVPKKVQEGSRRFRKLQEGSIRFKNV